MYMILYIITPSIIVTLIYFVYRSRKTKVSTKKSLEKPVDSNITIADTMESINGNVKAIIYKTIYWQIESLKEKAIRSENMKELAYCQWWIKELEKIIFYFRKKD